MKRGFARWGPVPALAVALLASSLLWPGIYQNGRSRAMTPVERRDYAAGNDAAVLIAVLSTSDEPRQVPNAAGGITRVILDRPCGADLLVSGFFGESPWGPREPLVDAIAARASEAAPLPRFDGSAGVRFVSSADIERWQDANERRLLRDSGYPIREWGVWSFSLPGYSADGRSALVYYEISPLVACVEGHLARLRETLGRWRVTGTEMVFRIS